MENLGQCPMHSDFNPFDLSEPHKYWEKFREESPVFYHEETGYFIVSLYEDIKAVFSDWETFSSENAQAPMRPMCAEGKQIMKDGGFTAYSGLSARTPPTHTRIRKIVQSCFGPRRFKSIEPKIEAIIADALEKMAPKGAVDFYQEVAYPVPALVLFTLMGIPDEDVPNVKTWAVSRALLTWGNLSDEEQLPHAHKMVEYWSYCRNLVALRKENLGDDLPSDLIRLQQEGAEISDEEIAGVMYSALFAGHETTTTLMANSIITLLQERKLWAELEQNPERVSGAVDEILRVSPSIISWRRKATKDTEIGAMAIPKDANILLIMGSGNRDETFFTDPDKVDFQRKNARNHLSFGYGIHFCLGSQLAKLELTILLRQIIKRFPDLHFKDHKPIEYLPNVSFRVPSHVDVAWGDTQS